MLALIALILFPFVIWQAIKRQGMAKASAAWPTAPGVITSAETVKAGFRTQPRVTYSYEKDGKTYTGNMVSFSNVVPGSEVGPTMARYPVGQAVTVHYSPADPAVAVLEAGASKQITAAIRGYCVMFAILVGVQFLYAAVSHWLPSDEQSKPRTYGDAADTTTPPAVNPQTVDKNIRDAAERGQATEQFTLGMWYFAGQEGVSKDPVEAAKWFRKSADKGNANAQAMLGTIYVKGIGVEKDVAQGIAWYQKAAAQGQHMACASLGYASENGVGLPKDREKAIEWYKKAGDVPQAKAALVRLGATQ